MRLLVLVLSAGSCFCDMDLPESIAEAASSKLISNARIVLGDDAPGSISSVTIFLYSNGSPWIHESST